MRPSLALITCALLGASEAWAPDGAASRLVRDVAAALAPAEAIATVPPAPWRGADDPADSLYRAARDALNDGEYRKAATLFRQIADRYPKSGYAPDAPYWEAFARRRLGGEQELRAALAALDRQRTRFPDADTRRDADALRAQIDGELARRGDQAAAQRVVEAAKPERGAGRKGATGACASDDDEPRIVALNALLQMDPGQAMPILREVLARRDACSEPLRRKAVFLVAQKRTPDAADILLGAARTDPDPEVRRQAVFWLSQVGGERATAALDSIVRRSADPELRERAVFALSQQRDARSERTLRELAESDAAPVELREKAVFWLGQRGRSAETAAFLRALYARPGSGPLREEIVRALAEQGGEENDRWLLQLAQDPKADTEARKKALFWLGQQRRVPVSEFVSLYDRSSDRDVKEQIVFVLSQRRESAATDKLMDIARREPDRELRGKALFWLGQKNDPRVKQLLLEIINQ